MKEKGTAGVDTVAQLKAMLGIADATPEEPAAPATPAEEPTAAESVPAAVGGQEEEAVVPVPPAVKEEEDATAMEVEAEAPPLPPPPLSPVAAAAAPVTAANRGEATAPAAAEVMEQEEQPPAEQEAEEPTGPPALLFPSEALTVEDAYGHGLAPEVLERVQALLRPEKDGEPPLVMPVVEGQRIMQAFKQELAARSVCRSGAARVHPLFLLTYTPTPRSILVFAGWRSGCTSSTRSGASSSPSATRPWRWRRGPTLCPRTWRRRSSRSWRWSVHCMMSLSGGSGLVALLNSLFDNS